MNMDLSRTGRAVVLAAWAGFFVYLWISGEMTRYLGPRTLWVIPFGAVVLSLAAAAHVAALRGTGPRVPSPAEVAGFVVLVLPIVAVLLVPHASLGAHAVSKKNAAAGGIGAAPALEPRGTGTAVSFMDIHLASTSDEYARAVGIDDGVDVSLTGFVTHLDGAPEGTFALTRFYVSCCAADAVPYSVFVGSDDGADHPDDTWLEVKGALQRRGDHFVVVAETVTAVGVPDDPYL